MTAEHRLREAAASRAHMPAVPNRKSDNGVSNASRSRLHPAAKLALALGATTALVGALRLLSRLPQREPERAIQPDRDAGDTSLGRIASAHASEHPGRSGLYLLPDAHDAFAARVLLAHQAERTLDLQYYIWHGDRTGTLLLEAVHRAAQRGVLVRLLLDDNGIAGLDTILAALDRHPNIQVRLFNPFRIRFPKSIGYAIDFRRLNRRMHNKSFTADGAATIIGGRNIGDEYFGAADGGMFADLDVLAIGPIVQAVEDDFERYWRCASAYPAAAILPEVNEGRRKQLASRASLVERDPSARAYVERLRTLPLIRDLLEGTIDLTWAPVRMISDDPAKALGHAAPDMLLAGKLKGTIGAPDREIVAVAGYFVPGDAVTAQLQDWARHGVKVSVLTNSYKATDVAFVHAGYAPSRIALLEAGVRLFELHGRASDIPSRRERRRGSRIGIGSTLRGSGSGSVAALRSRASTLHAKTFALDRERLFVGSFNLDPRSIELNTELGFVIESPELAARIADAFEEVVPSAAYEVLLQDGRLAWREVRGDETILHRREPGMTLLDHVMMGVAKRLPIRWLL
jgi:cardiolipin synthase C